MSSNHRNQQTTVNGHHVNYEPTDKLQPGLLPHLIKIQGKLIAGVLTVEHELQENRDFHVVEYPTLKSVGYFNRSEFDVIGVLTNYL